MAEWKADASRARHAKPKASREAGITKISLEQLEDSPYQPRHDMDLRSDISPLDAALGLQALRKLRPALNTAKKLCATTGLQLNKVTRLSRAKGLGPA
jgi:hypothetical protein